MCEPGGVGTPAAYRWGDPMRTVYAGLPELVAGANMHRTSSTPELQVHGYKHDTSATSGALFGQALLAVPSLLTSPAESQDNAELPMRRQVRWQAIQPCLSLGCVRAEDFDGLSGLHKWAGLRRYAPRRAVPGRPDQWCSTAITSCLLH